MSMSTSPPISRWRSTVVLNAKMRRTGVCGSAETILIDSSGADRPAQAHRPHACRVQAAKCRGDAAAQAADAAVKPASEEDWSTEYLDAIVSLKLVDGVDAAIAHIGKYGSQHTDSIIAGDRKGG